LRRTHPAIIGFRCNGLPVPVYFHKDFFGSTPCDFGKITL